MASQLKSKSPMQSPQQNGAYAPSVPISVYRELAAELHTTKAQLDATAFQNKDLVEQNQKLRLEIERVVQTALQLRQIADGHPVSSQLPHAQRPNPFSAATYPTPTYPAQAPTFEADGSKTTPGTLVIPQTIPANFGRQPQTKAELSAELIPAQDWESLAAEATDQPLQFTTAQAATLRRLDPNHKPAEIKGWQLAAIIFFIVITAFGAGFLLVRPLLPSNR